VANLVGHFPILSLRLRLLHPPSVPKKSQLQMLSRLPVGALKKAGAFRAATRSASVSVLA
jgi:hypothetical protein